MRYRWHLRFVSFYSVSNYTVTQSNFILPNRYYIKPVARQGRVERPITLVFISHFWLTPRRPLGRFSNLRTAELKHIYVITVTNTNI